MKQQQKTQPGFQDAQHNPNVYQHFPEFMQPYPYHFYPQYWKLPYYSCPDYQLYNKYPQDRCAHCRPVSFSSVMTQTYGPNEVQLPNQKFPESNRLLARQSNKINLDTISPHIVDNINIKEQIQSEEQLIREISKGSSQSGQESQSQLQHQKKQDKPINQQQDGNKQQILKKMLNLYLIAPQAYQKYLFCLLKSDLIQAQVVKFFNQKIRDFKKSKQQMIKLIIRKTQRHYKNQYNCKRDQRFKKFGGYKSMNTVYLQKLFSDPKFVKSYSIVCNSFFSEFDAQNNQKLKVFVQRLNQAKNQNQIKVSLKTLDQKNKMPWPNYWVQKLKKVLNQIKCIYINQIIQGQDLKIKKKSEK